MPGNCFRAASSVWAPSVGVRLHDLKFPVAQPAGLEQDAVGNADLADVVQRAGLVDQADVFGVDLALESAPCRPVAGPGPGNSCGRAPDAHRFRDRGIRQAWPSRRSRRRASPATARARPCRTRASSSGGIERFGDEIVRAGGQAERRFLADCSCRQQDDVDISRTVARREWRGRVPGRSSRACPSRKSPAGRSRCAGSPALRAVTGGFDRMARLSRAYRAAPSGRFRRRLR